MPTVSPTGQQSATLTNIESRLVQMGFSQALIAQYVAYYNAAVKQNPSVTPETAYVAWAAGTSIGTGAQAELNALGVVVNKGFPAIANVAANELGPSGLPTGTANPALTTAIALILGIFLMTFIAGINDQMGKITTLVMSGWLLIWTITHANIFSGWANLL